MEVDRPLSASSRGTARSRLTSPVDRALSITPRTELSYTNSSLDDTSSSAWSDPLDEDITRKDLLKLKIEDNTMDLDYGPPSKRRRVTPSASSVTPGPPSRQAFPKLPLNVWRLVLRRCSPGDRYHFTCALQTGWSGAGLDFLQGKSVTGPLPSKETTFRPSVLPKVPAGSSNAEMWKLFFGTTCQACGRDFRTTKVFNIPALGLRSCPSCLNDHAIKEDDLQKPPISGLYQSLPSVRANVAMDSFTPDTEDCPRSAFPMKLYSRRHVLDVSNSHRVALTQGPATVNSWYAAHLSKAAAYSVFLGGWMQYVRQIHNMDTASRSSVVRVLITEFPAQRDSIDLYSSSIRSSVGSSMELEGSPTLSGRDDIASSAGRATPMDIKEEMDPAREQLAALADNIIQTTWAGGDSVNSQNCSQFATAVLQTVRANFATDFSPSQDSMSATSGAPKLTLRHMKFVYDHKIKPIAEKIQPKLFRCSLCRKKKPYDLEGVMMHFASKHDSKYSNGASKIDWDLHEWPRTNLPFSDTTTLIPARYQASPSMSNYSPMLMSGAPSPMSSYRQNSEPPYFASPTSSYGQPDYRTHQMSGPYPQQQTAPFVATPSTAATDPADWEELDENSELNKRRRLEEARLLIAQQEQLERQQPGIPPPLSHPSYPPPHQGWSQLAHSLPSRPIAQWPQPPPPGPPSHQPMPLAPRPLNPHYQAAPPPPGAPSHRTPPHPAPPPQGPHNPPRSHAPPPPLPPHHQQFPHPPPPPPHQAQPPYAPPDPRYRTFR